MEAVEVVGEHGGFHEPLTVVLAPHGLAPARVGDGEVQAVGTHVVPVLRRNEVRDGVFGVMQHHLRVARSAAREVHEHGIERARLATGEVLGCRMHARVEVDPACALRRGRAHAVRTREHRAHERARRDVPGAVGTLRREAAARAVHEDERLHRGAGGRHVVDDVGDLPHRRGDDGLDGGAVEAVLEVVLLQHEGSRHHDGAELGERSGHEPELVVAAQDDHDHVAAADALRGEEVRRLVGPAFHVGEGEYVLLALGVAPHHGAAVGVSRGDVVDDVVAEVERFGAVDLELREKPVAVVLLGDVAQIDVPHVDSVPS